MTKLIAGVDVTSANGYRDAEIALVLAARPELTIDTRALHVDDREAYQMRAIERGA
jgi:hypothetical protein